MNLILTIVFTADILRKGSDQMKKSEKTMMDLVAEIRKFWEINPKTRVQDNEKKNKKKRRQKDKKEIREEALHV